MGNELVATYYIGHLGVTRRKFNVYGCWDKETPENEFDFFDVYLDDDKTQECINEGEPFYDMPSREEIKEFVKENDI
jgi:hypothetical protein